MDWRRAGIALVVALTCAVAVAPIGLAAKPTFLREQIDQTFEDEFLSEVCGVPVETRALGHQTTRSYEDGEGRLIQVFTINIGLTSTSDFGTFRFRDVGADVTRISKNGVVHQIIGKLPFWFNGTIWVDPITDEVLKQPTGPDLFESMLEKACVALNP